MNKYKLRFELKELPPSLNVLLAKGWRFRSSKFAKIKKNIQPLLMGRLPDKKLTSFKITFTRHTLRPLDIDNLAASFKPVLDALVINGIILDDKWSMTDNVKYLQAKANKKVEQKIVVEVEEI